MRIRKKMYYFLAVAMLWVAGMAYLIKREYFPDVEEAGVGYREILKDVSEIKRSQMGIYYGVVQKERIGRLYSVIEPQSHAPNDKTFEITNIVEFTFSSQNSSLWQQLQPVLAENVMERRGEDLKVTFITKAHVNSEYQLQDIEFDFISDMGKFSYEGKVKDEKLFVTYKEDGKIRVTGISLPEGTMMSSGIGLIGKLPALYVGRQFNMRWFDPMTQEYKIARSKVLAEDANYKWSSEAPPVHAYQIETSYGEVKAMGWFTEDGDVLYYNVLTFVFLKEAVEKKAPP